MCGVRLCYFEWGAPNEKPTVLCVHATGFHARCWDGVIRELGEGWHVVALDLRGHGRSEKRGPYDWRQFGDDVAAFAKALPLTRAIGIGHSMGGHAVVQAAARHPECFARLLLADPVIFDPDAYAAPLPFDGAEHPVARRRNVWRSPEEMIERFASRSPFSLWRRDVLADYCRHGLLPNPPDDGFALACPPAVEAAIYAGSAGRDIRAQVAAVAQPVIVLRARRKARRDGAMDFSQSPTWDGLAEAFANGVDVYLPELTHFIPMQRPDLVADHVRALAAPSGG